MSVVYLVFLPPPSPLGYRPTCSVYLLMTVICRRVRVLTDAPVQFGLIPHDHWYQPDWIDEAKATAARNEMVKNQVIYGGASTPLIPCETG